MLELSSRGALFAALARARQIDLAAYTLQNAPLRKALERAAERGAEVHVALESAPYARDARHAASLRALNATTARTLRAHGIHVRLSHADDAPLHLKAIAAGNALFLDDRNWPSGGRDTIVRTTSPRDLAAARRAIAGHRPPALPLALRKDRALASEAQLIDKARDANIDCESESFSSSRVFRALLRAAKRGTSVRLLVAARELRGAGGRRERNALRALRDAGVEIRTTCSDEKLCVAGRESWLGSANATAGEPHTIDWGARTHNRTLVNALTQRFQTNWSAATTYAPALRA